MSIQTDGSSTAQQIPFLDVLDPGFRFDSPEVAEAQERGWYADTALGRLVLRYAEAQELVRDSRLTHNGKGFMEQNGIADGSIYEWFVPAIVNHDGAHHRRLRTLVNKAFTPRMVEGLRPLIRSTADRLAEELVDRPECEFITDVADQLPLAVMTELLGVPAEDFPIFREWSADIGLVFSLALGGDIPARVEAAVSGLYGYVDALMNDKAQRPGDDLISALVAAQRAEGSVTRDELRNLVVTMVFAAHDTTRLQLANAMVTFSEHPDQWTLLGSRPELARQAVEEVMRWLPSSNAVYRFAAESFEFHGDLIEEGTMLMIGVQAAQRDPRSFPGGERFDITASRSATVLQFGGGPHYCLGAPLARLELGEALPALAQRLGPPSVAGPVTWRPAIGIYGPDMLPLSFGRREPGA